MKTFGPCSCEMESVKSEVELENGTSKPQQELSKSGQSSSSSFFQKAIWHGGSVYDAWLNAVSAQVRSSALESPVQWVS